MKKLCLLLLAASVSFSTMAQNDGGKKGKKSKQEKKTEKRWDNDGDRRNNDDRNTDWRVGNNGDNNNDRNNNGNLPRKVRDAFNRDHPSARNVNWSKNKGIWTASFRRSGLFGGNQTVSYQANGKRANNNQWAANNQRGNRDNDRDDD